MWVRWLGVLWLWSLGSAAWADVAIRRVVFERTVAGDFGWYAPKKQVSRVLFVVHGSLVRGQRSAVLARRFLLRWRRFARRHGLLLVAPAYDRLRYQSYGGYRGLFGRDIGADVFLDRIMGHLRKKFPDLSDKFYLYGHSAGGQFVVRYAVRHPHRLLGAVASAPGRYAFPTKKAAWPYGMGRLRRRIRYRRSGVERWVDIQPDTRGWLQATQIPLTVVVGSLDQERQPRRPAHEGWDRIETARRWLRAMDALAQSQGSQSRLRWVLVPEVGHSSKRLTKAAQRAFRMGQ